MAAPPARHSVLSKGVAAAFGSRPRQDMPIVGDSRDALSETEVGDIPMKETRTARGPAIGSRPGKITCLVLAAAVGCLSGSGCCVGPEVRQTACDAAMTDIPTEMQKISIPPYRVEPPDILRLDAVNNIRPANDPLRAGDELIIKASNTLPIDQAGDPVQNEFKQINNIYRVQTDGTVDLGPEYGSVAYE